MGADGNQSDGPGPGGMRLRDNRTVRFLGGLAEGFETIVTYVAICLFPAAAAEILWVFAAMVAITAGQRIWFASTTLAAVDT
jgi:hypothetical protein